MQILQALFHLIETKNPTIRTKGINKIAQKVGEEAVELIIEVKDHNDDLFLNEGADLVYHLQVLLSAKRFGIKKIIDVLVKRYQ